VCVVAEGKQVAKNFFGTDGTDFTDWYGAGKVKVF
jgi:hypothetical protein